MKHLSGLRSALLIGATVSFLALAGCGGADEVAESTCERDCLIELVDQYFAALVAGNPTLVPLAENVKMVEQSVAIQSGEGLWRTAITAPSEFKIYIPDPVSGQIGFLGMIEELRETDPTAEGGPTETGPAPTEIALRLKVENGEITEAEHLLARNLRPGSSANLEALRPAFLETVPEDQRMNRAELLSIGASYYDALVQGDGSLTPFADDCVRRENGMQTNANPPPSEPGRATPGAMGCAVQLDTKVMSYIKRIEPRRVEIADPVQGLVFGLSQFRQPMEEKTVQVKGIPGLEELPVPFNPFDLRAAHVFVVRDGKMHEIEAMGYGLPYDSSTGWE